MFEKLLAKYGPPEQSVAPSADQLDEFKGRLPEELLAFWREHGIGLWLGGKFQFCLPTHLAPVCERVFSGDQQIRSKDTHVVGYSAFGELLAWNERYQRILINLPYLAVRAPRFDAEGGSKDFPLATPLFRLDREGSFDVFEDTDSADPLFSRALGSLGPLAPGECFGFVPALAIGGGAHLDHLQRMDALVHFSFLADLGRCRLLVEPSMGAPEIVARMIGS